MPEPSQHTLEVQDTEGDLHKRMVSSKSIEVRYVRQAGTALQRFNLNFSRNSRRFWLHIYKLILTGNQCNVW